MKTNPVRLLIGVNVLLAVALSALWVDPMGELRNVNWELPAAVAPQIAATDSLAGPASVGANPLLFMAISERPLFAPDRRPPPPPALPAPPPPPDPMASVQLIGMFSGAEGGILARIEGKVRRVRVSDSIGAWRLENIEGREANFVQGDISRKMVLEYSKLGKAVAPPAPAAAPAAATAATTAPALPTNVQDEMRERLKRRNEVRARAGLPPAFD